MILTGGQAAGTSALSSADPATRYMEVYRAVIKPNFVLSKDAFLDSNGKQLSEDDLEKCLRFLFEMEKRQGRGLLGERSWAGRFGLP